MLAITLPPTEVEHAKMRVRHYAIEWFGETPIRLHVPHEIGDDGAPKLNPEFVAFLEDGLNEQRRAKEHSRRVEIDAPRRRVTKAFRLLRRRAPKEFDVLYCMVAIDQVGRSVKHGDVDGLEREFGASLRRTRARLNQRALKRGESTFSEDDLIVLVVSGVRKLDLWSG